MSLSADLGCISRDLFRYNVGKVFIIASRLQNLHSTINSTPQLILKVFRIPWSDIIIDSTQQCTPALVYMTDSHDRHTDMPNLNPESDKEALTFLVHFKILGLLSTILSPFEGSKGSK